MNELKIKDIEYAKDGKEAFHMLKESLKKERPYDCCIIDYGMPILNGIEVIKWYKEKCKPLGVTPSPMILYSAYVEQYFAKYDLKALNVAFLSKPIGFNDLKRVLSQICKL